MLSSIELGAGMKRPNYGDRGLGCVESYRNKQKSETIDGIVPYTTIINSIGNEDYTMHIQGRTTGVHDVYPTDIRSGTSDNSYQFKTSIGDTLDGDSGGPHFKIDGGYVYIMGVHAGVHSDDNEPVATSAEYVEKEFDLKIPVLGRDKL